jgi:hypothetical protein
MGADDFRIRLSLHAALQAERRGVTIEEIAHAIGKSTWEAADRGRHQCRRDFDFDGVRLGRRYRTKKVRPIFVVEADEIVVVTVYAYYF